jgi:hypothetical protein
MAAVDALPMRWVGELISQCADQARANSLKTPQAVHLGAVHVPRQNQARLGCAHDATPENWPIALLIHAAGQILEDIGNRDARSLDAGLAAPDAGGN